MCLASPGREGETTVVARVRTEGMTGVCMKVGKEAG